MRKRLLTALLAAALLLFSTAFAAPIAANFLDTAALIDEDGAEIVAPGAYDFIFALDEAGELFCGGSSEGGAYRYALLNGAGEPLSGAGIRHAGAGGRRGRLYAGRPLRGDDHRRAKRSPKRPTRNWSAMAKAASSP